MADAVHGDAPPAGFAPQVHRPSGQEQPAAALGSGPPGTAMDEHDRPSLDRALVDEEGWHVDAPGQRRLDEGAEGRKLHLGRRVDDEGEVFRRERDRVAVEQIDGDLVVAMFVASPGALAIARGDPEGNARERAVFEPTVGKHRPGVDQPGQVRIAFP